MLPVLLPGIDQTQVASVLLPEIDDLPLAYGIAPSEPTDAGSAVA
jgi:hypothetical protein